MNIKLSWYFRSGIFEFRSLGNLENFCDVYDVYVLNYLFDIIVLRNKFWIFQLLTVFIVNVPFQNDSTILYIQIVYIWVYGRSSVKADQNEWTSLQCSTVLLSVRICRCVFGEYCTIGMYSYAHNYWVLRADVADWYLCFGSLATFASFFLSHCFLSNCLCLYTLCILTIRIESLNRNYIHKIGIRIIVIVIAMRTIVCDIFVILNQLPQIYS